MKKTNRNKLSQEKLEYLYKTLLAYINSCGNFKDLKSNFQVHVDLEPNILFEARFSQLSRAIFFAFKDEKRPYLIYLGKLHREVISEADEEVVFSYKLDDSGGDSTKLFEKLFSTKGKELEIKTLLKLV